MSAQVSQFDYSAPSKPTAVYRYRQVPADSPATPSLAGTWNASFTLPRGSVYNLSRSLLTFSISTLTNAATRANAFDIGMLPIQSFRIRSERGVLLEDLQDVAVLSRARPFFYSKDELNKNGKVYGNAGAAHFTDTNPALTPAGALVQSSNNTTVSAPNGHGFKDQTGILQAFTSDRDYRQYLIGATANGTTDICYYKIPLKDLIGLTSVDKDLFHANESLIVEITFLPVNEFAFQCLGASGITDQAADNFPAVLAATPMPTPCVLQLAIQSNQAVANDLISLVNTSGLRINYPYVWLQKRAAAAGTSFDDIYKLNISRGKRLQRILFALSTTGSNLTGYHATVNDNDATLANRRIGAARSSINAVWEQDGLQETQAWYDEMKNNLKDAVVDNTASFRRCGFLMRDYTSSASVQDWKDAQTQEVGMSLIEPIDFGVSYTKINAAQNSYIYAICQKTVALLPTGVSEA